MNNLSFIFNYCLVNYNHSCFLLIKNYFLEEADFDSNGFKMLTKFINLFIKVISNQN